MSCVQDVAVTVFVLQALAVERGAPASGAEQEAARLHVAGCPGQIPHALKAEHGLVDVERDHDPVAGAVTRRRGDPAANAAGFGR
jgi:hypothetical protein